METDWFKLVGARLQMRPYQRPYPEVAVAAQVSPAGPRAAGKFGCSLLSIGATSAGGFDVLGAHWDVMEERAEEFGTTVDRSKWRLVGPMHIADTKEQAIKDVEFGLEEWVDYFQRVAALPLAPDTTNFESLVDALNASGFAVIGTVEDAIAQVARLRTQSKGLRHLPAHGARVGRHRGHPPLLRAHRPIRGPRVPGLLVHPDRQPRLGGREPARVHRGGRQRRHVRHPEAPRRESSQGAPMSDSTASAHRRHPRRHPRADPGQRDRAPRRHRRPGRRQARGALPRLPRALVLLAPSDHRPGRRRLPGHGPRSAGLRHQQPRPRRSPPTGPTSSRPTWAGCSTTTATSGRTSPVTTGARWWCGRWAGSTPIASRPSTT